MTQAFPILGPDGVHVSIGRKDDSKCIRKTEQGIIDSVMLTTNEVRIS